MKQHLVLSDWFLDQRAGGPPGYLANLRLGLDRLAGLNETNVFIQSLKKEGADYTPTYLARDLENLVSAFTNLDNLTLSEQGASALEKHKPLSVHCNVCAEMVKIMNWYDKKLIARPILIFTSHSPESWGKEVADIWRLNGFRDEQVEELERCSRVLEAKAFRYSDAWIFPSEEAMEPYWKTIPQFSEWVRNKPIQFVRTGAPRLKCSLSKEEAKRKFGLSNFKVIAFLGRHIKVKGYDLLQEAAKNVLSDAQDVAFLIAGRLDGLPPLQHERWKELGWYQKPEEVLTAADIFVLPNRMTFFDLMLIEAMSMGTAIVASATGGNKTVAQDTDNAIRLFEPNVDHLAATLIDLLNNPSEQERLRMKAQAAYVDHYTTTKFAEAYINAVTKIQQEFSVD